MGRAGSPIYKGEPGDYDLPFVRSFQLFCPIKISIFSPIAATLSRVRLLQCRSLPLPPPAFRPFLSGHPPYGNIDRAQPRDSSPSHPRPSWCTATAFSLLLFLSVSLSATVAFSLFLCLHLRYSGFNIQLLATRALVDRSQKAGNEVAYGFCVHTNGRVLFSLPSYDCRLTVRPRGGK